MVTSTFLLPVVISALVFINKYEEVTSQYDTKPPPPMMSNKNCRNRKYPRNDINRLAVPDDKVQWSYKWDDYKPPFFTAHDVNNVANTDPDNPGQDFLHRWNKYDYHINRTSYCGKYDVVNSLPINPVGRTGLAGRGMLPRWGPNHWIHLIITKHQVDDFDDVVINHFTGKPVLEILAIRNIQKMLWAVPGRMIIAGETQPMTVRRTYYKGIGAIYDLQNTVSEKNLIKDRINKFFEHGEIMYQGYVDDQRNTDNAWIETTVLHYHDKLGDIVGNVTLIQSDKVIIRWIKLNLKVRWIARNFCFMANITRTLLSREFVKPLINIHYH